MSEETVPPLDDFLRDFDTTYKNNPEYMGKVENSYQDAMAISSEILRSVRERYPVNLLVTAMGTAFGSVIEAVSDGASPDRQRDIERAAFMVAEISTKMFREKRAKMREKGEV